MKETTKIWKIESNHPMNIGWKSARVFIAAVLLGTCCGAFLSLATVARAAHASPNGAAGQMPAYYDAELFTVNMFEVPASDPIIGHKPALNIIYATNDLDEEQDFSSCDQCHPGRWIQSLVATSPHRFQFWEYAPPVRL